MSSDLIRCAPGPLVRDPSLLPEQAEPMIEARWRRGLRWVLLLLSWGVIVASFGVVTFASPSIELLTVLMGALFLTTVVEYRPLLRLLKRRKPQFRLLDGGAYDAAISSHETWLAESKHHSDQSHGDGLLELGYFHLRAGHATEALAILSEAYRRETREANFCSVYLALAFLSAGDLEGADAWVPDEGAFEPARVAVLAHQGRFAEVLQSKFRTPRRHVHRSLLNHDQRVFALARCYARDQLGREPDPKDLDKARPLSALEYGYLTQNWPELSDYIQRAGIEPTGKAALLPAARARLHKGVS